MPEAVRQAAVRRIAEHAYRHSLPSMRLVLHGGEPLLAGVDVLAGLATAMRDALPATCRLSVGMQTNGVALREDTLERLSRHRTRVGVSVDGRAEDHDRHRRFRDGTGSHAAVARALTLLRSPRFRDCYAGILCTVDPTSAPVETYEALLAHEPPGIDFLLPHANWERPPERPEQEATPHADWLISVFDRWYDAPRRETGIRLFDAIMSLLLGGSSRSEQVGLSPVAVAVVETDGEIELVDSLKSAYPGACTTGFDVHHHAFDAALDHPGVAARQIGEEALGELCRQCAVRRVCGGGHYAHRYRPVVGFRNPSVYCADMQALIGHIGRRMAADAARLRQEGGR